MVINLIYIFTIIIGIYFGIKIYIQTKHKMILAGLAILVVSLLLELQWLNIGSYLIDTSDIFRTTRDIAWTILMIV